ncbi:MAG: hypothetical protein LUD29_04605 [Clostridia bacterium]|nr:hypothetical protein [Clostridia bacterium]
MANYYETKAPAPHAPAPFDAKKTYTANDIRSVIDYYNYKLTWDKFNYLQFEDHPEDGSARAYITGKYEYITIDGVKECRCFGIRRYQSNLFRRDYFIRDTREDPDNYYPYRYMYLNLTRQDTVKDILSLLERAEKDPEEAQAMSGDRPPRGEPHPDWKYRYHYLSNAQRTRLTSLSE